MLDTNVYDFEVQSGCDIQKCGAQLRKFDKSNLKSTYRVEKQTLFSTLLLLKNHTLSSAPLQTLTLCSTKSCKNSTLSVLAWVYYFLMGATPPHPGSNYAICLFIISWPPISGFDLVWRE